jgi:hypothetical protein
MHIGDFLRTLINLQLKNFLDQLMPYIWRCHGIQANGSVTRCPIQKGDRLKHLVVPGDDWRYEIESITYHRDLVVIKKTGREAS